MAAVEFPIVVKLSTDDARFRRSMGNVNRQGASANRTFGALGGTLRGLFAGFSAAAVVRELIKASEAARKFEDAFIRIETLVGEDRGIIGKLRYQVSQLAPELGRMPQELADALFFVESAGFRGAEAMEVLRAAGKGAALGLGTTAEVADAATSAINAYGVGNLSAEESVNTLFETVREGKISADELATSIGSVIGLAKDLGVEFQEVGSFIAAYTRTGGSAAEATTALQAILQTLLKPTTDAELRLAKLGLSVDDVRRSVAEDGLAPALIGLVASLKGNKNALGELIPETRALRGVLKVAGTQAETYLGINDRLTDGIEEQREAWKRLNEETNRSQEIAKLKGEIEKLRIEIGDRATPAVALYYRTIAALLDVFRDLGRIGELGAVAFTRTADGAQTARLSLEELDNFIQQSAAHWNSYAVRVRQANDALREIASQRAADEAALQAAIRSFVPPEVPKEISSAAEAYRELAEAQRLAAIDQQAVQWHSLLDELSPGIKVLREFAAQMMLPVDFELRKEVERLEAELTGPAKLAIVQSAQDIESWRREMIIAGGAPGVVNRGIEAMTKLFRRAQRDALKPFIDDLKVLEAELTGPLAAAYAQHLIAQEDWARAARDIGLAEEEVARGLELRERLFQQSRIREQADALQSYLDRVQQLRAELEGPLAAAHEAMNQELASLERQLDRGEISWDTYREAVKAVRREYELLRDIANQDIDLELSAAGSVEAIPGADASTMREIQRLTAEIALQERNIRQEAEYLGRTEDEINALLDLRLGRQKESLDLLKLQAEAAGEIKKAESRQRGYARAASAFEGLGTEFGQAAAGAVGLIAALDAQRHATAGLKEGTKEYEDAARQAAQNVSAAVSHMAADIAATLFSGPGEQTIFGQAAGDRSQEGAALGEFVGGLFGDVGAGWGRFIGTVIGGLIKTEADELRITLDQAVDGIRLTFEQASVTELYDVAIEWTRNFQDAIKSLEEAIHGTISIPEIDLRIVAGEWIEVWGQRFRATAEGLQEAFEYAVIGAARQGELTGVSPEVEAALRHFSGARLEEFNETLELALKLEADRVGPIRAEVAGFFDGLMQDIQDAVRADIPIGGAISRLADYRDELLGIERSEGERVAMRVKSYEAERLTMEANLLALRAQIEAEGAVAGSRILGTRIFLRANAALQEAILDTAGITTQAAASSAAALAAIDQALAALDELAISPGEAARAVARAGRGSGDPGAAQRAATREQMRYEQELRELRLSGASEATIAAREFERQLEELESRMREAGMSAEEIAAAVGAERDLRAQALAEEREALMAERRALIAASEAGSTWAVQLDDIRRRQREAIEALGPMAATAEGLKGPTEELGIIAESTRLELEQLGRDALGSLGSTSFGVRQEAEDTAATIDFLRQNLRGLGLTAEEVEQAVGEVQFDNFQRLMREALGFLELGDLSTAERAQAQEALIALEQASFLARVAALKAEVEVLAQAGLLTDQQQEAIARALALVDDSMESILEGIANGVETFGEDVVTAGQTFASTVQATLSGFGSGTQADQAFQLLQQLAELQNNPPDQTRLEQLLQPLYDLMAAFEPLAGFLPAFGTTIQEVTAQINDLIDLQIAEFFASTFGALQAELAPGGAMSGASNRQQLATLRGRIMQALAEGRFGEAEQLARQGLDLAAQTSGMELAAFRDFVLAQRLGEGGVAGTGLPPRDEFGRLVSITQQQHSEREDHRLMQTEALVEELRLLRGVTARLLPDPRKPGFEGGGRLDRAQLPPTGRGLVGGGEGGGWGDRRMVN